MRIEGSIYPIGEGTAFTREAWCDLVARRSEFRRYPPREGRNPFTGGTMVHEVPPDSAEVVFEGQTVGNVSWSQSDEPLVNVSIEPSALFLVHEWATIFGGEFRADSDTE